MATMDKFELSTELMGPTAEKSKMLAEKMRDLRSELESAKNDLLFTWAGKGRNEFEKQFRLLNQQFSDIIDDAWEMYESIIEAEQSYIQADVDAAKTQDGIERNF